MTIASVPLLFASVPRAKLSLPIAFAVLPIAMDCFAPSSTIAPSPNATELTALTTLDAPIATLFSASSLTRAALPKLTLSLDNVYAVVPIAMESVLSSATLACVPIAILFLALDPTLVA